MKNPVRNVVVEYKNKRARKGNASLWGNLDLKTIARKVAADTMQASMVTHAEPEPAESKAELNHTNVAQKMLPVVETIDAEREHSVVDAAEPERATIAPGHVQKPAIAEGIIVRRKNQSSQRGLRKGVPQKMVAATHQHAMIDIRAELSFLEQENASLKRELIAKLRTENANLVAMLMRVRKPASTYDD